MCYTAEYFLYDPTNDFLNPALLAYELVGEGYLPMTPLNETVTLGELAFPPMKESCPNLKVKCWACGLRWMRRTPCFCNLKTGERLLSDEEALLKAKAENAQVLEEIERLRRQLAEK